MPLPAKEYFSLEEIEARWRIGRRDLAYYAENGLLEVSARIGGLTLEEGHEFEEEGSLQHYPTDFRRHVGLLPLLARDLATIFRMGGARVYWFRSPPERYLRAASDDGHPVAAADLVVTRAERDRFERAYDIAPAEKPDMPEASSPPPSDLPVRIEWRNDHARVVLQGEDFRVGPTQARVLKRMHDAWKAGRPWIHGKAALREAGARSLRMVDLFKSQPRWRDLIRSDGRGHYRLNLPGGDNAA